MSTKEEIARFHRAHAPGRAGEGGVAFVNLKNDFGARAEIGTRSAWAPQT